MLGSGDGAGAPPVVVLNESAADLLWPDGDPVGRQFELGTTLGLGGPRMGGTVVGVVSNLRHYGLGEPARPEVFATHSQFPVDFMSMVVRSTVPPRTLISPIREQLREMDSELPMDGVRTMEQRMSDSVAQPRFYMLLLTIFAGAALFLAAIGIYGVLTYAVRQRVSEIGIRRVVGAQAGDVMRMVIGRAIGLAAGGLILGLFASFALTRVLSSLLYGIEPTDPGTLATVAMLLMAIVLLAAYLPARRAALVDPATALREE